MMPRTLRATLPVVCLLAGQGAIYAQRGVGDWTTTGYDAQRSFWVRNDAKISPESMQKPGFELVWKLDLNEKDQKNVRVSAPVLLDFYIGYRGFRSLGFLGSASGSVVGIDTDLARFEWRKGLEVSPAKAGGTPVCPGGMTSGVTRLTTLGYPPVPTGRGPGRGNPARSAVGAPFEGAVTLRRQPVSPPPTVPAKAATTPSARVAPPPNPFAARIQWVHSLTSDGKLHSIYASNGEEPKPGVTFLPPNANAQGLIVFDQTAYVATSNSCGGVENGVWALDLENQKVAQWKAGAKGVAGSVGPAVSPDGTLYIASGGELVALEQKTLQQKGSYSIGAQKFTSSPVVFDYDGKDLIAATSADGKLHLVAADALSTAVATSPVFSSANYDTGALASWQDTKGVRWILAPAGGAVSGFSATNGPVKNGAIVAWKVVDQGGKPTLQPGWVSRDMASPLTPIIVSGVVFAVSSGEFRGANATAAQKAQRSAKGVLYALDSATGKELWNSGTTIPTYTQRGGLAAGGSKIYVASQDGTQYVFGFPIEH